MLKTTQRRLLVYFVALLAALQMAMLAMAYLYLHQAILGEMHESMSSLAKREFEVHFFYSDIDSFKALEEDELFQVFDDQGQLLTQTVNFKSLNPPLNPELFQKAQAGQDGFEELVLLGQPHLLYYFRLNQGMVGRIIDEMGPLERYEQKFLRLVLVSLPGILLLAYFLAKALVRLAIRPVAQAFEFQENFSSYVTHELQTPLAALRGAVEVALRKPRSSEEYQEVLAQGLEETKRMGELLEDLHFLASSEFKSVGLQLEKLDLARQADEAVRQMWQKAQGRGVVLSLDIEPCELLGDAGLLRRALHNLLSNAIKYSLPHQEVSLLVQGGEKEASLVVKNSCQGLDKTNLQQLLEPFQRGGNQDQAEGKGLGLAIVQYIAQAHGGSLKLSLEEGQFVVRLRLPRTPA